MPLAHPTPFRTTPAPRRKTVISLTLLLLLGTHSSHPVRANDSKRAAAHAGKDTLAITFDDLPASGPETSKESRKQISDRIIKTLINHKVPQVYGFINGIVLENQAQRYEILNDWKKAGFLFGNHTYSHLDYGSSTFEAYRADIEKNETFLTDFAGSIQELKVFRFPYLHEGENQEKRYALRAYFQKRKYQTAQVTVDFQDWMFLAPYIRCTEGNDTQGMQKLKDLYLSHAENHLDFSRQAIHTLWGTEKWVPQILLLHYNAATAQWLNELLKLIENKGYSYISAAKAIRDKTFEEDTTFVGPTGKSFLLQALETRHILSVQRPQLPEAKLNSICRKQEREHP